MQGDFSIDWSSQTNATLVIASVEWSSQTNATLVIAFFFSKGENALFRMRKYCNKCSSPTSVTLVIAFVIVLRSS